MKDFFDAGRILNEPKCNLDPALCLRQLGFDVDMGEGKFRVPVDRWEALQSKNDAILAAQRGRVHAKKLSNLTGTVISMKLVWGQVTQLHTRHLYSLINSVFFLNSWVTLTEEARGGTAFLATAAAPPRRRGQLAPAKSDVHPGGRGRERLRVGRAHHDWNHA